MYYLTFKKLYFLKTDKKLIKRSGLKKKKMYSKCRIVIYFFDYIVKKKKCDH